MSVINSLISPVLGLVFKFLSKRRLPQIMGTLNIHGLEQPVQVTRDKHGIPHIQATSEQDLFLAQGFIHAQDRLWQMELNRRTAKGTLSEIFGKLALDTDRLVRTVGFHRLGKEDWKLASDQMKQVIEAYVAGINQFIDHFDTKIPLEFSLIKHKPELWTPEDVLAVSRLMIWQLSHAWFGEVIRSKVIEAVGEEHAADLEITYPKENPIELPNDIEFNILTKGKLKKATGPFIDQNMGSNAWAISAQRSKTGSPILANDMHLKFQLPSLWYVNHLKSKDLNVTGVSIPGLPLVLVGHNDSISWGATLSFNDCEDLFIEKFNPDNQEEYKVKDKWERATVIREIIKVKDDLNHQEKVFITRHGPIISAFIEGAADHLALQSRSLQPTTSLDGWYLLNKASNWDEFVKGISQIGAPSLNIMYADKENIGYYNSGSVPIRKKGDGRLPVPGWTDEYEWKGDIPFEEMPHALNPEKGYLISCNNKIVSDSYKHYLGENFMNGYRASRLEQFFDKHEQLGIEESIAMQNDLYCTPATQFLPYFENIEIDDPNPDVEKAFDIMMAWDGHLTKDSVGGALYEVTKYMAIKNVLEQHLGPVLTQTFMGEGLHPIVLASHEFYGHDTVVLLRLLEEEDSWWIKHIGGRDKLLLHAFNRAFEWFMEHRGLDIKKWTWGSIHQVEFEHPLSVQKPLDRIFNRGPYPVGGDTDTPNQMATMPGEDPFKVKAWAPSWRQIVDLKDLAQSKAMFPPGQSGQLASKHYDDLIDPFLKGEYFTQYWTRGQIENNQEGTLELHPTL